MFPKSRRNRRIKHRSSVPVGLDGLRSSPTTRARIRVDGTGCDPDGLLKSTITAIR